MMHTIVSMPTIYPSNPFHGQKQANVNCNAADFVDNTTSMQQMNVKEEMTVEDNPIVFQFETLPIDHLLKMCENVPARVKDRPHKCNICAKTYTERRHLTVHMRIHTGEKPYSCDICNMHFSDPSCLARHFTRKNILIIKEALNTNLISNSNVDLEKSHFCDICMVSFPTKYKLDRHNNGNPHKRKKEGQSAHSHLRSSMMINYYSNSTERIEVSNKYLIPFPVLTNKNFCSFCDILFATNDALDKHNKEKHYFPCTLFSCNRVFLAEEWLKEHIDENHGISSNKSVSKINSEVASKNSLISEESIEKDFFPCTRLPCNKVFLAQEGLKEHIEETHGALSNKSSVQINSEVPPTNSLMSQESINRDIQQYTKEISDLALLGGLKKNVFSQAKVMSDNKVTKTGENSFRCNTCEKTFPSRKHLYAHKRTHVGPYKCEVCPKSYSSKSNLNQHYRTHTGFICKICDMSFTCFSSLTEHNKFHEGKKHYSCKICDKSFTCSSAFADHKNSVYHLNLENSISTNPQSSFNHFLSCVEKQIKEKENEIPNAFSCDKCRKSFTCLADLIEHKSDNHQKTIDILEIESHNSDDTKLKDSDKENRLLMDL
jgi:KRAB domain-containing zinc finger protein